MSIRHVSLLGNVVRLVLYCWLLLGSRVTDGRRVEDECGIASEEQGGGDDDVCIESRPDSHNSEPSIMYLFGEEDSFVVEEYMDNSTIPWRDPDGTFTMVTFYLPYCEGCKKQKEPYKALSRKVKELIPDAMPFRSMAVSCHSEAHKSLCHEMESIISFPAIRLYSGDGQSLAFIPNDQMHPIYVLQRLGTSQSLLHSMMKPVPENEVLLESDSETLRILRNYESDTVHRHQQMLLALSMLLRSVYENHKDTAANERDPPLPETVAKVVHDFLWLLEQTLPRATAIHDTVHELLQNYIYIRQHQRWLEVILDEHTTEESNSVEDENEKTVKTKFLSEIKYWDAIWDLFLTMAQGVAEWNDVAVTNDTRISTVDVRNVLQQFALHAGWSASGMAGPQRDNAKWIELLRNHQITDYLSLEEQGVSQHRALTLWLADLRSQWDVYVAVRHNQNWLDAGWPYRKVCEVCWEASRNKNVHRISPYQWNDENVYDFVRLEYGNAHLSPYEIVRLHEHLRRKA